MVHSLTKFMGGHGTTLGGAIVDSGRFPWKEHARRFPMFSQPDPSYHDLVYTDHFKEAAYIGRCRAVYQRTSGAVLSPLSAFLLLQGIETIPLTGGASRGKRQSESPNSSRLTPRSIGSTTRVCRKVRISSSRKSISVAVAAL